MNRGIAGSAGCGIGKVVVISDAKPEYENKAVNDIDAEISRYDAAVAEFAEKTHEMAMAMKESVGAHNADILEGHIVLLTGPGMEELTKGAIMGGTCAEAAFESTCNMFAEMFRAADDELTRQRASDIGDIKIRMLKILTGTPDINISNVPEGTIIVADDLYDVIAVANENMLPATVSAAGKKVWEELLHRLQAENKAPVLACISQGNFRGMTESRFIVQFTSSMMVTLTMRNYRQQLETILAELTGKEMSLHCICDELPAKSVAINNGKKNNNSALRPPKVAVDFDEVTPVERKPLEKAFSVFGDNVTKIENDKN